MEESDEEYMKNMDVLMDISDELARTSINRMDWNTKVNELQMEFSNMLQVSFRNEYLHNRNGIYGIIYGKNLCMDEQYYIRHILIPDMEKLDDIMDSINHNYDTEIEEIKWEEFYNENDMRKRIRDIELENKVRFSLEKELC